jgi:aminoglycoside phosphotransferase family enzyme
MMEWNYSHWRPPNAPAAVTAEAELAQKVAFLSRPDTYGVDTVACRETHMSWVFLAGRRAYKLKKPVRFPYLDFSTLARREAACRAELRLNRRLAPDVYLAVEPLILTPNPVGSLSLRGSGLVVDWVVVMQRLDERNTLQHALEEHSIKPWQLDRIAATLVQFYRRSVPFPISPALHLEDWRKSLLENRKVLLQPRLCLPAGLVTKVDAAQRRFLAQCRHLLVDRVLSRRIVDGHGDLRPEHIWLGDPVRIIDCLEFNDRLRASDPLDEIAFLSLECERLGIAWAGRYLRRRVMRDLRDDTPEALFRFYHCHRATLRARLAIAHLLEQRPRTPEKWRPLARRYLEIAAVDATQLMHLLKSPASWSARSRGVSARLLPRTAAPLRAHQPFGARRHP